MGFSFGWRRQLLLGCCREDQLTVYPLTDAVMTAYNIVALQHCGTTGLADFTDICLQIKEKFPLVNDAQWVVKLPFGILNHACDFFEHHLNGSGIDLHLTLNPIQLLLEHGISPLQEE